MSLHQQLTAFCIPSKCPQRSLLWTFDVVCQLHLCSVRNKWTGNGFSGRHRQLRAVVQNNSFCREIRKGLEAADILLATSPLYIRLNSQFRSARGGRLADAPAFDCAGAAGLAELDVEPELPISDEDAGVPVLEFP